MGSGALRENHDLVTYQSQGQTRGLTLNYKSTWADPRPIFHFDYPEVDADRIFSVPDALHVVARASVVVDGVEIVGQGFENPGQFGLVGGENFFSIPDGSGPLDGALQVDLSDQPTGIYTRKLQVGLRGFTGDRFIGSSTILGDEFVLVNNSDSAFGSGWGLAGLQEIVEGPDGSVAIIDGDGSVLRWEPGVRQTQDFLASDQSDESVKRFDGNNGFLIGDFVQPGAGGLNNPHNPTFSPDGNLFVVSDSGGANPGILRYDGVTGEFLDVFVENGEGGFVGAAEQAFAPDGSLYAATVSGLGVLRYDRFGNFIDSIAGPGDGVQAPCGIEFGPDGLLYVWDTADEEMRRFDPATGDFVDVFIPSSGAVVNACDFDFGTDGDIFITDLTFSTIRRFSGEDGSDLGVFANTNPGVSGVTFGPDGNFYANVAGNTHQFNGQTGEFINEFVPNLGGFNNFFPPPPELENANGEFINPAGDFSTLHRRDDGIYTRTFPNQTVVMFNADNKLDRITDRNGNATIYQYNQDGNIASITDPVGLVTTFDYDNGLLSTITDPANRETSFQYDAAGNLTQITDPDGTSRSFTYDERHLMTGETDKRGNQEFEFYDEFGRATGAILADGTEIQVTPRHVRGLHPAGMTSDPNNPAPAARGNLDTEYIDGNGNSLTALLDAAGQLVVAEDGEGQLTRLKRDPVTNLVTSTTDPRGNITQFTYDDRGNLTSVIDSVNSGRLALVGQLPIESFPAAFGATEALRGLAGDNDLVYVFGDRGVHTVDISNLANPTHLSVDDVNGSDRGTINGTSLLAVSGGSAVSGFSDLMSYSLTGGGTPQDPDPRDTLPVPYVVADEIVSSGDFAFVSYRQFRRMGENDIFEQNGTVASFDISNPDNLVLSDLLFNDNGATNEAPVVSMGGDFLVGGLALAAGNTLYVGSTTATGTDTQTGDAELLVVDITDPTAINSDGGGGGLDNVLALPGVTLISDILVDGDVAFVLGSQGGLLDNSPVAAEIGPTGNATLTSLNIADPRNPTIIRTHILSQPAAGLFDDDDQRLIQIDDELIATYFDANDDTGPQLVTFNTSNLNNIRIDQSIDLASEPTSLLKIGDAAIVTTVDGLQTYQIRPPEEMARPPEFVYHPTFNVLSGMSDELGRQTFFQISPFNGNTLSITQIVGAQGGGDDLVTQFTYDDDGLVDNVTDPLGRVTDLDYDAFGRLTSTTFAVGTPDEANQQYEYDDAGNVTAIVDERGNRTELEYDAMNRLTRYTEADPDDAGELASPVTHFTYDAAGNLESLTDPRSATTTFTYDSLHRQIGTIDAQNKVSQIVYDGAGNIVSLIDPSGDTTQFEYDLRDRLIETTEPNGGLTTYTYDPNDNVVSVTDPNNNQTQFTYDARDRVISETDQDNGTSTFAYDALDNQISRTNRNGLTVEFQYDDLRRPISETWVGDGNVIQYGYDDIGNLVSIEDDFSSVAFSYDNRDRLKTADNAGTPNVPNVVLTYSYDDSGNVTSLTDDSGGTNTYQYDNLNRMIQLTQSGSGVTDKRVDLTYDPLNRFETITRFSDLAGTQTVVSSAYMYDSLDRLTSLTHSNSGGQELAFYRYQYDADSRVTQVSGIDGITTYNYDRNDQLLSASRGGDPSLDESYQYDAGGNRTQSHLHDNQYVTGSRNQLQNDGTFDYQYDAEGNLTLRTNIATGETREFTWDYRNRLTTIVDMDVSDNVLQTVRFTYDGLDRRISKSVETAADDVLTHFVYDRSDVLLDFVDDDGAGGPNAPTLAMRYLHGPAVDQVLAQDDGDTHWLLPDRLGSIRDIVSSDGTVTNHIRYDSYGNLQSQTNPQVTSRYGFQGRELDHETGLYHYRTRYFDPSVGRFISEDRIGFAGGDRNLYRFVSNSPTNFKDPNGEDLSHTGGQCTRRAERTNFEPRQPMRLNDVITREFDHSLQTFMLTESQIKKT